MLVCEITNQIRNFQQRISGGGKQVTSVPDGDGLALLSRGPRAPHGKPSIRAVTFSGRTE